MSIISKLKIVWKNVNSPFLVNVEKKVFFKDILANDEFDITKINEGDVVALIGDFDPKSILRLINLIEKKAILVHLTHSTLLQHEYFFKAAYVDVVIEGNNIKRINHGKKHHLIDRLRNENNPGLVLFSTGTTGQPKAILHNFTYFINRYQTPRAPYKTINFLLFDHIGGLNTLFHTLFNKGTVIVPKSRNVKDILEACKKYNAEVLPVTPTFLRMMLMSGLIDDSFPKTLKIITYGTERMDQPTLDNLCSILPNVDFRQTYGMSELGILRVKTKSRQSLYMKVGGEGIDTKINNRKLYIRSKNRMLGYLNAENPFDAQGWYNTNDIVEEKEGFYKIIGRNSEFINIAGIKFMPSEVEKIVLKYNGVLHAKVVAKSNPITGEHAELIVEPNSNIKLDKLSIKNFLIKNLPAHMIPARITIGKIEIGSRFKKK